MRLGSLNEADAQWSIHRNKLKSLLSRKLNVSDFFEHDVQDRAPQKGVNIRFGLDIASMCFRKPVDQIALVSGDSDFVTAEKLARREGVDFILHPAWAHNRDDPHERIDTLRSVLPRHPRDGTFVENDNDSSRETVSSL